MLDLAKFTSLAISRIRNLGRAKACIAALVLLGIAELFLIDIFSTYLKIQGDGGMAAFGLASAIIFAIAFFIVGWTALKLGAGRDLPFEDMRIGAEVCIASAILTSPIILAFAVAGAGIEKLVPVSDQAQWESVRPIAYAILCSLYITASGFAGAVAGAFANIIFQAKQAAKKDSGDMNCNKAEPEGAAGFAAKVNAGEKSRSEEIPKDMGMTGKKAIKKNP